jgi:glutathione S-transferase
VAHFHQTRNWVYFQCSIQGPYFGQKAWFGHHHPEKVQSAINRYDNKIKRVTGVLDLHLAKQGSPFLVGDKCTYSVLMFVPYIKTLGVMIAPDIDTKVYKEYTAWLDKVSDRSAVENVVGLMDQAFASAG